MKQIAVVLLLALTLGSCSSSTNAVQTAAGQVWEAQLAGGEGEASGFSFVAQFTITGTNGSLDFSSFQFLNAGGCFPVTGASPTGSIVLTSVNQSTGAVAGTVSFTITGNGNTLTLSGNLTGTVTGVGTSSETLSGATATGYWTLTGGSGCNDTSGGTFTMTVQSGT